MCVQVPEQPGYERLVGLCGAWAKAASCEGLDMDGSFMDIFDKIINSAPADELPSCAALQKQPKQAVDGPAAGDEQKSGLTDLELLSLARSRKPDLSQPSSGHSGKAKPSNKNAQPKGKGCRQPEEEAKTRAEGSL